MENNPNDLCHHGILGQKWGVRRYQNKDGSLTSAGKKHVNKLKAEYTELTGKQMRRSSSRSEAGDKDDGPNYDVKKIPTSKMTDKELQDAINRLRNQNEYNRLISPKSRGQKFVEDLTQIGIDIAKESTKQIGNEFTKQLIREMKR